MTKRLGGILAGTAAVLLFTFAVLPQSAKADTLDFNITAPSVGTLSYAGGANPLVGSGISVFNVVDVSIPISSGNPLALSGLCGTEACLDFTTGNLTSSSGTEWFFGPNSTPGSVTIVGGNSGAGISTTTTLLTGTVDGATVNNTGSGTDVAIAVIVNSIDNSLMSHFGINFPLNTWKGTLNLSFDLDPLTTPPDSFTSTAMGSGDLRDTPVPEPTSLLLLGSGLLGLAFWGRKRFGKFARSAE